MLCIFYLFIIQLSSYLSYVLLQCATLFFVWREFVIYVTLNLLKFPLIFVRAFVIIIIIIILQSLKKSLVMKGLLKLSYFIFRVDSSSCICFILSLCATV